MLEIQTSTELMIQNLTAVIIICTLILIIVIFYIGVRMATAYEQAQSNIAQLAANVKLATDVITAGQGSGGYTEAQVQVLADNTKVINNSMVGVVPGAVAIP